MKAEGGGGEIHNFQEKFIFYISTLKITKNTYLLQGVDSFFKS